jgi:hypothetical protein
MEELEIELGVLKQVQESQGEIIRGKHNEWNEEMDAMKKENKKLDYMLFDLLKLVQTRIS